MTLPMKEVTIPIHNLLQASRETLVCLHQWKRELEGKLEYPYIVAQLEDAIAKLERMELER